MRVEAGWQLTVEGPALALERVDDVEGRHGLALGVFGVCDRVADDVLEEHLEDTAGLLVDEAGDTLDTATASQTADSRLGDALDVVAKNLAVALRSAWRDGPRSNYGVTMHRSRGLQWARGHVSRQGRKGATSQGMSQSAFIRIRAPFPSPFPPLPRPDMMMSCRRWSMRRADRFGFGLV